MISWYDIQIQSNPIYYRSLTPTARQSAPCVPWIHVVLSQTPTNMNIPTRIALWSLLFTACDRLLITLADPPRHVD